MTQNWVPQILGGAFRLLLTSPWTESLSGPKRNSCFKCRRITERRLLFGWFLLFFEIRYICAALTVLELTL